MSDQTPPQGPGEGKPSEPLGNDLPEALRPGPGDLTQPTGGMSAPEPAPPSPPAQPPPVDPSATRAIGETSGMPGGPMPPQGPPQGAPPPQGIYNPPPQQGGYTPPPQQGGYMPPPQQGGYPPQQGGYQGGPPPPPQGGYGAGYGAPPPQGGYGAPPPPPPPGGYGYGAPPPPPPPQQAGIMGLLQSWLNAVTKPNVGTYENESRNASWLNVFIGIAVVAVIGFLLSLIGIASVGSTFDTAIDQIEQQGQQGTEFAIDFLNSLRPMMGYFAFISLISPFITFFLGAGVQYMAAKILGGKGDDFLQFSYLASISYTPLRVASTLVSIVPLAGGCVSFILEIYQIYCVGVSMQVSQKLDSGKAQMAAFASLIVLILFFCLCFAGTFFIAFMGAAANG